MARISPLNIDQTDATTAATLKGVQAKLGMVPNLLTTMAHAPAALNGYLQLAEALSRGSLTLRQRELIAIAVAQENGCEYCLSAHAVTGRSAGLTEGDIDQARHGLAADPTGAAIIDFALRMVRNRGAISDGEIAAARQAGLTDSQIIEIVANVALNVMTNYTNRVADTAIDFPVVQLAAA